MPLAGQTTLGAVAGAGAGREVGGGGGTIGGRGGTIGEGGERGVSRREGG